MFETRRFPFKGLPYVGAMLKPWVSPWKPPGSQGQQGGQEHSHGGRGDAGRGGELRAGRTGADGRRGHQRAAWQHLVAGCWLVVGDWNMAG